MSSMFEKTSGPHYQQQTCQLMSKSRVKTYKFAIKHVTLQQGRGLDALMITTLGQFLTIRVLEHFWDEIEDPEYLYV